MEKGSREEAKEGNEQRRSKDIYSVGRVLQRRHAIKTEKSRTREKIERKGEERREEEKEKKLPRCREQKRKENVEEVKTSP